MTPEDTIRLVEMVQALEPDVRRERNLALLEAPPLFDLELVSSCNVVCTFCPRSGMVREKRRMSAETFSAVEAFLPENAVIMLSGLGEALLHPHLASWVEQLNKKGHSTCLITNGVLLTPTRQRALIDAGLAQFQVSVHGLDEESVAKVMPVGARPAQVKANLEHLALHRPEHLRVRLNFVETKNNGCARDEVELFAKERGFDFFYRREHTRGGSLGEGRVELARDGCGIFASVTFISSDGEIFPCVNDVAGHESFGNVRHLRWPEVLAWKENTIMSDKWFSMCGGCDDDFRWVIIGQDGLDERRKDPV